MVAENSPIRLWSAPGAKNTMSCEMLQIATGNVGLFVWIDHTLVLAEYFYCPESAQARADALRDFFVQNGFDAYRRM